MILKVETDEEQDIKKKRSRRKAATIIMITTVEKQNKIHECGTMLVSSISNKKGKQKKAFKRRHFFSFF